MGSYKLRAGLREQPRAYKIDGRWVGVGGAIVRPAKPPQRPQFIPEATEEQYLRIAAANPYLVQLTD